MNSQRLTIVLVVLLVSVLSLTVLARPDLTQTNWVFLRNMKRSPAAQAFEPSREFANGRVQQPLVPGTIPRGFFPLHYAATKEEAVRAGEELVNPFRPNAVRAAAAGQPQLFDELAASTQRGELAYRVYCVSCHGQNGAGDGPVAQRGFPPPPPLPTGKSSQMKDGQLFHILTYGQGSMSSMAAQLDRSQRWDAINYVRSLQAKAAASQPPSQGDAP